MKRFRRRFGKRLSKRSITRVALFAPLAVGLTQAGCYTRVVDAKGIGGDSTELRESAERDARPGRRVIRRSFLDDDNDR